MLFEFIDRVTDYDSDAVAARRLLNTGAVCAGTATHWDQVAREHTIRIAWSVQDRTIPFERFGRPYMEAIPDAELVHRPESATCR